MMLIILLLSMLAAAEPEKKLIITESFFPDCLLIHNGSRDIVEIAPLNQLDYGVDISKMERPSNVFYVEADINENGEKDLKGVYVLKDGQAEKVLENGQTVTIVKREVFIGAKDGIYKYNVVNMTAEKFGDVTESVIKLALHLTEPYGYYLTEDYVLYKTENDGRHNTKVDAVKDARDMILDFSGYLIFYDGSKQFYVYYDDKVEKISIKSDSNKIVFIKPCILLKALYVILDEKMYRITEEGPKVHEFLEFEVKPSALAPDAFYWQYFVYNKKIYEYNFASPNEDCRIPELGASQPSVLYFIHLLFGNY